MASNRIKGITVEIDGNTVKLQESLKEVDKSLKTTQTELKDVNKLLKLDPTNTDLLKQKSQLLTKAIADTNTKLEEERKALKALEEGPDASKTIKQQEALKREIIETSNSLKNYKTQLMEVPNGLDRVSNATAKLADKTRILSATAVAGVTALGAMVYKTGQMADTINTMSKQSGFSTEEIQKWQYASDRIDVSVDTIVKAGAKLTKTMASESASVTELFDRLGVSFKDVEGNLRPVQDVFYDTIEALSKIPNETERDQLAMEIFGKSANELAGIIDDGGEALRRFGQEASDAGLILSQDALDGANAFNDGLDEIKIKAQTAFYQVGAQIAENLLPVLEDLIDKISEVLTFIANLDSDTIKLVGTLLLLTAGLSTALKAFSAVTGIISGITKILPVLTGGIAGVGTATGTATATASAGIAGVGASLTAILPIIAGVALAVTALIGLFKTLETYKNNKEYEDYFDQTKNLQNLSPEQAKYWMNKDELKVFTNPAGEKSYYVDKSDYSWAKANASSNGWTDDAVWGSNAGTTNYNFDVNVQNINDIQDLLDMSNQAELLNRMGG